MTARAISRFPAASLPLDQTNITRSPRWISSTRCSISPAAQPRLAAGDVDGELLNVRARAEKPDVCRVT